MHSHYITNNLPHQNMNCTRPGGEGMILMQPVSGIIPIQNPQWVNYGQQQPPQSSSSFYPCQIPPISIPLYPASRFECPRNTSKPGLSYMFHMRLPTNQYMDQTGQQPNMNTNFPQIPRQQFMGNQYNLLIQNPWQTEQHPNMNNNFQPVHRQQFLRWELHNVPIQPLHKNTPQMYPTQQPTQMYSNMQQIENQKYCGGFVQQQPGIPTPYYMQNENTMMYPMCCTQNPVPPHTRPTGSNQQAQNSQYHQMTSSSVTKMSWSCLNTKEDLLYKFGNEGIDQKVIEKIIEKRDNNLLLAFRDLMELSKVQNSNESQYLSSNGEKSQPDASTDLNVFNTIDWEHLSRNETPTERILYLVTRGYKVMVLMRGCPGSGKSYKAINIINQCYVNPNYDEFIFGADKYFINKQTGSYLFDRNKLNNAHRWVQQKVQTAVQEEVTPVIIDNTNSKVWHMETYVRLAVNNGYWIEILDPETEWAWNGEELAKKNIHNVPFNDIFLMLQQYDHDINVQDLLNRFKLNDNKKNYTPKLSNSHKMYKLRKKCID